MAEEPVVALYRVFGERNVRQTWLATTRRGIREHLRAVDDEVVQRDGTFVFEDGFEA